MSKVFSSICERYSVVYVRYSVAVLGSNALLNNALL